MTRLLALLFVLVSLTVASCGGDDGGGGAAEGEVQFLVFGDPEELKAYREVIEAFKAKEPDVRVQLVEASDRDDLLARLATSIAGGRPPDLFLLNYRFYGQFADKGQLEPIEDRLSQSDALEEADFYPQALDAFRFDGKLSCLPQNISSLVVYHNKALFREAGLPLPSGDWTWKQFVDTAVKLTDRERGQ
jgi:multiple sugar transport system substrate-binding protein